MEDTLISVLIGTTINYLIWQVLAGIAILDRSKHEKFLVNGTLVSGVITLAVMTVCIIYKLVTRI